MTFEEKYEILGTKNTAFDGTFFTAVKTTSIFCHPSCRARTPKAENVIFYDSIQEALHNGYRPCKICKPTQKIGETPEEIKKIIDALQDHPHIKISDETLKERGVEPHTIRRWFKKNHQMTFHSYQRMIRINHAFTNMKKGESVTRSAFGSGYESLSGFNETYRSIFGDSASHTQDATRINIMRFSSPIGKMLACATDKGLCFLGFVGQKKLEENLQTIQKTLQGVILPGKNKYLSQVKKEINQYFLGERKTFEVALDLQGTEFRKKAWRALQAIPYGQTITYKKQALAMNNLKAIRAVATANGANNISIIIPCHRVIGSDGSLTGYAGGLHKKKWLLDFEKLHSNQAVQTKLAL